MEKAFTLRDIADFCSGRVRGDENFVVSGIAPLEAAGPSDLSLAMNAKYLQQAATSRAGALIVGENAEALLPEELHLIISPSPYWAFAKILKLFYPAPSPKQDMHPSTVTGENFSCAGELVTGPHVVIGNHVVLGRGCRIGAGTVIGDSCRIGDFCTLAPNVTLYANSQIGNRVEIHSASVIGADGFGFAPSPDGLWEKIPHLGWVEIGDDVEIGAGCTIDRGTFGPTRIGSGVKMDDQVHVGHNVVIGDHSLLVAQVGIAGSTKIGRHVILAGKAGISGHIEIGDGVRIGPMGGIVQNVPSGQTLSGAPGMPHRSWLKVHHVLPELPDLKKRLIRMERKLADLSEKGSDNDEKS
ncbi:UDP-3-O-(3-hydroxymyristoyl)glucosamine N-acyltransferase [Desulfococcaceae bacterium OttesenSCG-928-F15]|nr:UDP-3-O-(3-hydroxymyristoyl)glucosamine N-acyltransferase [Desulfococcaceae bacterium OttesenSCG-928-F15]